MKKMIRAGLVAVLLAPAMAAAQAPPQPSAATVSEAEATKIALARIPGKATKVTIDRKRGRNVYVVKIQAADGGEKAVFVDIDSGQFVGTEWQGSAE